MIINQKSLREQVYDFIREELTRGKLIPGDAINLNAISQELGISKTPLRDALLQLDTEGFVTISPVAGSSSTGSRWRTSGSATRSSAHSNPP